MGAHLQVRGLCRTFPGGQGAAVDGVDFEVEAGETLCIVGPSGCGKSTTLRLVAGLERPDGGDIVVDGRSMRDVEPQARDVAMVFQGFALYPHLNVRKNLEFPLEMRKIPRKERKRAVEEAAELLGLTPLLERFPAALSGGERQRVAMGRAVVRAPKVFLFDEPLSNLDAALRTELRIELGRLLRRLDATALYVTHDQTEAMTLGHRIALMRRGRIEQLDRPRVLYGAPGTIFCARFFGSPPMNVLDATVDREIARAGSLAVPAPPSPPDRLAIGIRPEDITIADVASPDTVLGMVAATEPHGADTHILLQGDGWGLRARAPGFFEASPGTEVGVKLDPARVHYFDADSERRL
jgi:multiple sugar transport system ATP-binding protein